MAIWLTVMLIALCDLSPVDIQDALALRYHRPLLSMPASCDVCGSQSSI